MKNHVTSFAGGNLPQLGSPLSQGEVLILQDQVQAISSESLEAGMSAHTA